jgi:hypothetical protein
MVELVGPMMAMAAFPVVVAVFALYIASLSAVIQKCSPGSRTMDPGMVWLMLIPFFGFIWQFAVARAVARSLENEYRLRGLAGAGGALRHLGIANAVVGVVAFLHLATATVLYLPAVDVLDDIAPANDLLVGLYAYSLLASFVLVPASFVLLVVYWSRASAARSGLAMIESADLQHPGYPWASSHFCGCCGLRVPASRFCSQCGADQTIPDAYPPVQELASGHRSCCPPG